MKMPAEAGDSGAAVHSLSRARTDIADLGPLEAAGDFRALVGDNLAAYYPPNPRRHGLFVRLIKTRKGEVKKDTVTHDGQPVMLELITQHLGLSGHTPNWRALGYLPVIAGNDKAFTTVGMIDLDAKAYAGLEPDAMENDRLRLRDIADAVGFNVYFERSSRGHGWHVYLFTEALMPLEKMTGVLRGWATAAAIHNAEAVEVYPMNGNPSGRWYIMPYAGAGKDDRRLGHTHLQTEDGVPIPFDELDEWIKRTPNELLERLIPPERSRDEKQANEQGNFTPDGLEALQAALLKPRVGFERHGSIIAALNLAERMKVRGEMITFLKSDELRRAWITDGSRTAEAWADEVDRWAKAEGTRRYGFPYLKTQGFRIPDLSGGRVRDNSSHSFNSQPPWPAPLKAEALHGLAGEVVRTLEPHSEADPGALLANFLTGFGNMAGPSAHMLVEASQHPARLNVVLAGDTAKGRKGTSWGPPRRILTAADPDWQHRIADGLSSGEGVIWAVRDSISKRVPVKEKGRIVDYQDEVVDDGVNDKRLMVVEGEFARVLRVLSRDGNTLSAILRNAWDSGELQTLTKNSPAKATGAHVSIIAHITKAELLSYLNETESVNGFGNRFLWLCVKRSKVLPFGGDLGEAALAPLIKATHEALVFARTDGRMSWGREARGAWAEVYPVLSKGKPGLLGALLARAEAQVLRLALTYALLDKSRTIEPPHLYAALAIWQYAEESTRYIFGGKVGNSVADDILEALKGASEGLTRTQISDLFKRHRTAGQIDAALQLLELQELAHAEQRDTGGRPLEVWFAQKGGAN